MSLSAKRVDADAEQIEVLAFDGKIFALSSARALAPGQPIALRLLVEGEPLIQAKSLGSKLGPDGRFQVRARAVSLARELRENLVARL